MFTVKLVAIELWRGGFHTIFLVGEDPFVVGYIRVARWIALLCAASDRARSVSRSDAVDVIVFFFRHFLGFGFPEDGAEQLAVWVRNRRRFALPWRW